MILSANQKILLKVWQIFALTVTDLFKLPTERFTHVGRSYVNVNGDAQEDKNLRESSYTIIRCM